MTLRCPVLVLALWIAAGAAPTPSAPQTFEYALYIGYRLPDDPALEADARGLVSECISRRATCSQACRVGTQDSSCSAQCEIAFRECALGARGTKFWLGTCPKSRCADGLKVLLPLTAQETTHSFFHPAGARVDPNMYSPTGLTVRVSDRCTFERSGEVVRFATEYEICEAIRALGPANIARGKKTPLIAAIEANSLPVVEFLLTRGVDPNELGNTDGLIRQVTPLAIADSSELVKALLHAGADPTLPDTEGMTPLHARERQVEVVRLLLDAGADANARAKNGGTPLHGVSDQAVISLLVARGADVNAATDSGETPLHWAAHQDNLVACHALVKAGANLNLTNTLGQTPLAIATEKRHFRTVLCLKVAGGKL